jgi:hypothetical protein
MSFIRRKQILTLFAAYVSLLAPLVYFPTLKMEGATFSETSANSTTLQRFIIFQILITPTSYHTTLWSSYRYGSH